MTKLWGGRFSQEPAAELMAFTESLSFDRVLAREDCEVLGAHARALVRVGLIGEQDLHALLPALEAIATEIEDGSFPFDPSDEDIHTAVERALLARLPDIAPRVRAGLSRNDRAVTALRLWLMRASTAVIDAVCDLIELLVVRAEEHASTPMPGYTHLQRAQPITLGHHLLAHAFALERDARRFADARGRTDALPLGAGALAGSTLRLTQQPEDLGFSAAMDNSLDAVAARDFVAEFLSAAAICGVHCSRLGEEIVLWTSTEFGSASLGDAYATGSSLMPQKKNPDIAELARGKSGRLIGNLTGLLAALKGLPLSYNRDLQEDKEPLFDSVRTLRLMLPALRGAVASLTFDLDRLATAASDPALVATDLAEHLVAGGLPFRDAHEHVGVAVARAATEHRTLADVVEETFGAEAAAVLDAARSIEQRGAPGPNAASVAGQLARLRGALSDLRSR